MTKKKGVNTKKVKDEDIQRAQRHGFDPKKSFHRESHPSKPRRGVGRGS